MEFSYYFGDPCTFPVGPPGGHIFHLTYKISEHIIDGLVQHLKFMVSGRYNIATVLIP